MNVYLYEKVMRNRSKLWLIILILVGIVGGVTGLFFVPKKKAEPVIADKSNGLEFSRESGFYDEEFDLAISAPSGMQVYYTLDGSEPSEASIRYEGPIHLKDASENENVYSVREDVSTAFCYDLIEEYSYEKNSDYKLPDYKVDKCNVVRAVGIDADGKKTKIKTCSYFIGFDKKTGYDSVKVLSLVTDPTNLFDYNEGIYTTGAKFDEFTKRMKQGELDEGVTGSWQFWEANYSKDNHLEKEFVAQFFEGDELVLSQKCGAKVHGGANRAQVQKSFNLYARDDYGEDLFKYNLFDNSYYPKRVVLYMGSTDEKRKILDWLTARLCKDLNIGTMNFEPYAVFLDGEYWGFYWLTERYDEEYLTYYYNVDPANVIMIKNDELKIGKEEDYNEFLDFQNHILESDMTTEESYEWFVNQVDLDSFLDYYACLIYVCRQNDWPLYNVAIWKTKVSENGKYNDGKWRYLLFDVNNTAYSEKLSPPGMDSFDFNMAVDDDFKQLMTNDKLRNQLLDRVLELEKTVYSTENVDRELKLFHSIMDEPMKNHCKRFWGEDSYYRYEEGVQEVDDFLHNHHEYVEQMVEKHR